MASYSLCMLTTYMVQPNGIVVHAPDACLHFVVGLFNIYNFFSTPFCVPPPPPSYSNFNLHKMCEGWQIW